MWKHISRHYGNASTFCEKVTKSPACTMGRQAWMSVHFLHEKGEDEKGLIKTFVIHLLSQIF